MVPGIRPTIGRLALAAATRSPTVGAHLPVRQRVVSFDWLLPPPRCPASGNWLCLARLSPRVGLGLPHRFFAAGGNWVRFARSVPLVLCPQPKLGSFRTFSLSGEPARPPIGPAGLGSFPTFGPACSSWVGRREAHFFRPPAGSQIGFVSPKPLACTINHNPFSHKYLPIVPARPELALFCTLAPCARPLWPCPTRHSRELASFRTFSLSRGPVARGFGEIGFVSHTGSWGRPRATGATAEGETHGSRSPEPRPPRPGGNWLCFARQVHSRLLLRTSNFTLQTPPNLYVSP